MDRSTTQSIRAIAGIMIRQFVTPFLIGGGVVVLLLLGLVVFLATQYTGWWLVFLIPLAPIAVIYTLCVIVVSIIFKKITPSMTLQQKKAVKRFTATVGTYSDIVGTSRFLIAFRIVRDVIRKRPRKYLGELLDSSTELKRNFEEVRSAFSA